MFNKHLFKVILGFCGMIVLGLGLLVVINSFKSPKKEAVVEVAAPVKVNNSVTSSPTPTKNPIKQAPKATKPTQNTN